MDRKDIGLLNLSAIFLGLSYTVTKFGLASFAPMLLTGFRYFFVAIILLPFFFKIKLPWGKLFALSMIMSFGFQTLIVAAINGGLDVSTSIICQQMSVPFTSLLGMLVFKDKLGIKKTIGLIIAFIGMVIVVGGPNIDEHSYYFVLLAICSAFFYALHNIILKELHYVNPYTILFSTSLLSFPALFISSYIFEKTKIEEIISASGTAWISILYLSILSSVVAFGIWIKMLHKYSVHQVAPFSLLMPIYGIIGSYLLLDEHLGSNVIIGGTITILGIAVINIRNFRLLWRNWIGSKNSS